MTLLIGDVSSHNAVTSWPALLASVDGVIVKVSQNNDYVWPGAAAALTHARGKLSGAYHYAGPSPSVGRPPQAPTVEADFFLANYAHTPGEVVVCDFEPAVPPADPDGWVHDWCQRVLDRIGVLPWVYLNATLARSGPWTQTRGMGCQLWVAQYGANTGGVPSPAPSVGSWGSYIGWQYTSVGSRPGVSPLDLSQFYIDAATWRAAGTPGGDDLPFTEQQIKDLTYEAMGSLFFDMSMGNNPPIANAFVGLVALKTAPLQAQIAGLSEALKQLAAAPGQTIDLAAVQAAAEAGAEAALAKGVDVNVNVGGQPASA